MKTELKYGLLFAIIVMVYVMIEHVLGLNTTRHDIGQYSRLAGVLVPILGVFFGIRAKRDKELNGTLTFGQGVKTGLLIDGYPDHSDHDLVLVLLDGDQPRIPRVHAGIRAEPAGRGWND